MINSLPSEILAHSLEEFWDIEDSMSSTDLWASPLGKFVAAFNVHSSGPDSLRLLALFAARRALACWKLYCDGTFPLDGVVAAERSLADGSIDAVARFQQPALPSFRGTPIRDCRECDTSSSASAVSHMARLFCNGEPRELALCLSAADTAFDQSPLGGRDQFRRWLLEVAVPAAMERRELTSEEMSRFRDYSLAQLDREREQLSDIVDYAFPPRRRRWSPFA
jgi:hypothetical protein